VPLASGTYSDHGSDPIYNTTPAFHCCLCCFSGLNLSIAINLDRFVETCAAASNRSWRIYCCCFLRCFPLRQHVLCSTAVTACCLEAWGTDVSRGASPDRQRWQGPAVFGGSRMTYGACARLSNGCRTYVSVYARIQHFGSLESQPVAVGGTCWFEASLLASCSVVLLVYPSNMTTKIDHSGRPDPVHPAAGAAH
jgi:hypothetical protein